MFIGYIIDVFKIYGSSDLLKFYTLCPSHCERQNRNYITSVKKMYYEMRSLYNF